jgi:hypothetical protein
MQWLQWLHTANEKAALEETRDSAAPRATRPIQEKAPATCEPSPCKIASAQNSDETHVMGDHGKHDGNRGSERAHYNLVARDYASHEGEAAIALRSTCESKGEAFRDAPAQTKL